MGATPDVTAVLFDLDGTLVDDESAAAVGVEHWLLAAGWAGAAELPGLVGAWRTVAERHFPDYRARRTTFQGQRRARVRDFLPLAGVDCSGWTDRQLDDAFDGYLRHYEAAWRSFPDAAPCLRALGAGVGVAVLSNGDQQQQTDKLHRTGLAPLVPVVLTSDLLGPAKPDPEVFLTACRRLGVAPATTAYVGDRLDVDAVASRRAGLRGIWLDRRGGVPDPTVETIHGLAELPPLLGMPEG